MKYFQLQEDERITHRPQLVDVNDKMDTRDICMERAYRLPYRELVLVRGKSATIFTDVITKPFLLVSEKVRNVILMYEPGIVMKELVLLDRENALAETYYLPILPEVDCLGEGTEYNPAHTALKKIVINREKAMGKTIFKLAGVKGQYIICNLDIVESILKRGCLGIGLTEVEITA